MFENDGANVLAEKVNKKLKDGEKLIWCGKTEKGTTPSERGVILLDFIFPIFVIGVLLKPISDMYSSGDADEKKSAVFAGVLFIGVCVLILCNSLFGIREIYAITDRRLLIMTSGGFTKKSVALESIFDICFTESGRQIGCIKGRKLRPPASSNSYKKKYIAIRGVKSPAKVCNLLSDAVAAALSKYAVKI